ncbi:MAG: hypothetical protein KME15_26125 [Drouetiella hepatica Uher 2000/2452]|jgi:Ca2+-binding RTX toxin-like protein|uniref:Calcium-binding protein n=1 Tax=Drouetiella hepatica Uher 2000/2452 TaxID=904376 RepID=A0A951QFP0_9CYAN|nr:hypothetical protein [Drouetiella hepatica Uher 2000/2452]
MTKLGQVRVSRTKAIQSLLDEILVKDASSNSLNGGSGNDVILGLAGDDRISGGRGNDVLLGGQNNDQVFGGQGNDFLLGEEGNDQLQGDQGRDFLDGGTGNDSLLGGDGRDVLVGGAGGADTLTGGSGADAFVFAGDVFAGATPIPAGTTGIQFVNQPDVITDYAIGQDQFVFNAKDLNINSLTFQKGVTTQIAADGNFIIQLDPFINAATAARAIANNPTITAKEGVFVYFNTTLGINRLVYSQDLANGGNISILANLTNQSGESGIASLNNFTTSDFSLT